MLNMNSCKHTRQLQIMENMNYPGNSWEGCLSWLPSRRRPILSGAPYPQISPHPGQLKILRIHVHVLLSLIYPLHCFISIVDAWDLLEFMIYQSCSEGGPLFLALRILKFSIYHLQTICWAVPVADVRHYFWPKLGNKFLGNQ